MADKKHLDKNFTRRLNEIIETNGKRTLTVITPFKSTENTAGVNCLQCHEGGSRVVNGAVRISLSLDEIDEAVNRELWMSIGGSTLFFFIGLVLVNLLLKSWIITPLNNLMDVVNRRARGERDARAVPVSTEDELGKLAISFNHMSDSTDEAAAREQERVKQDQEAAEELRTKVDELLRVVNKVAQGDYTVEVSFSGTDTIGELANQLQSRFWQES